MFTANACAQLVPRVMSVGRPIQPPNTGSSCTYYRRDVQLQVQTTGDVMSHATVAERTEVTTRPTDQSQARELLKSVGGQLERPMLRVPGHPSTEIPPALAALLGRVLTSVANGGTITIAALPDELTTTVAAEQLGISRPTLMKLIHTGQIPSHKVGSHHRLHTSDVLAFRKARIDRQAAALEELRALEQDLDQP